MGVNAAVPSFDQFTPSDQITPSFEQIVAEAAASPAGARGLLFLPYLNGERCPHPDPAARGAFIGLTACHNRGDVARAVMEGVVHALVDMHTLMKPLGINGRVVKHPVAVHVRPFGGRCRQIFSAVMSLPQRGC